MNVPLETQNNTNRTIMKNKKLFYLILLLTYFSGGMVIACECCHFWQPCYWQERAKKKASLKERPIELDNYAIECLKFKEGVFTSSYTAHPERHNPFNIIYSNWGKGFKGCTGESQGVCVFDKEENGVRAGMMLVLGYVKKGYNTTEKFIRRYSATDQEPYIKFMCINMGIASNDQITDELDNLCKFAHFITVFEGQNGKRGIAQKDIRAVCDKFGLKDMRDFYEDLN